MPKWADSDSPDLVVFRVFHIVVVPHFPQELVIRQRLDFTMEFLVPSLVSWCYRPFRVHFTPVAEVQIAVGVTAVHARVPHGNFGAINVFVRNNIMVFDSYHMLITLSKVIKNEVLIPVSCL